MPCDVHLATSSDHRAVSTGSLALVCTGGTGRLGWLAMRAGPQLWAQVAQVGRAHEEAGAGGRRRASGRRQELAVAEEGEKSGGRGRVGKDPRSTRLACPRAGGFHSVTCMYCYRHMAPARVSGPAAVSVFLKFLRKRPSETGTGDVTGILSRTRRACVMGFFLFVYGYRWRWKKS